MSAMRFDWPEHAARLGIGIGIIASATIVAVAIAESINWLGTTFGWETLIMALYVLLLAALSYLIGWGVKQEMLEP